MYYFGKSEQKTNHQLWCDAMVRKALTRSTRVYSVKAPVKKTCGVRRYSPAELRAMFEKMSA